MVRVRFAPSPTGNLHIGTLRTALFTWLFARHHQGVCVLRIEDTDRERSKPEYETSIFEGLDWMGLTHDEGPLVGGDYGPYRQSERLDQGIYQTYLQKLMDLGLVYPCFCSDDDLEKERELAKDESRPYVYSRRCKHLPKDTVEALLESSESFTYRFAMPLAGTATYTDLIRGDMSFDLSLFSDFVIMKSDGMPTYNFAVVVDDILMAITHVIRGEDHISNMPRQLALFDALGEARPHFAHLPMILGQDRSKLSKRHGATSVSEYRDQGFLSDAFFNFLTLLGWSPDSEQELFSRETLIERFSLDRVSKSNAVFDLVKLTWMNGQYIRALSDGDFLNQVRPFVSEACLSGLSVYSHSQQDQALLSVKGNLGVLSDINGFLGIYTDSDAMYQDKFKALSLTEDHKTVMRLFAQEVEGRSQLLSEDISDILTAIGTQTQFGKGHIFKPVRLLLTGEGSGPHLGDIVSVFGLEKVLYRLAFVRSLL